MIETASYVVENCQLQPSYFLLRLCIQARIDPAPGQFVMVRPHGEYEPLLRRALVFYRTFRADTCTEADFVYRTMGRGTTKLSHLRAGDQVDFLGPLGRGFEWEGASVDAEALLVSGGIGIPALLMWAQQLSAQKISVRLFHGARTADPERGMICVNDFIEWMGPDRVVRATEDGSVGVRGFITDPLEAYLRSAAVCQRQIFACGPHPMMKRVAELAVEYHTPAQVCLEAPMACGFGVCVACVVKLKGEKSNLAEYHRVCTDGPVFDAAQVVWG